MRKGGKKEKRDGRRKRHATGCQTPSTSPIQLTLAMATLRRKKTNAKPVTAHCQSLVSKNLKVIERRG